MLFWIYLHNKTINLCWSKLWMTIHAMFYNGFAVHICSEFGFAVLVWVHLYHLSLLFIYFDILTVKSLNITLLFLLYLTQNELCLFWVTSSMWTLYNVIILSDSALCLRNLPQLLCDRHPFLNNSVQINNWAVLQFQWRNSICFVLKTLLWLWDEEKVIQVMFLCFFVCSTCVYLCHERVSFLFLSIT